MRLRDSLNPEKAPLPALGSVLDFIGQLWEVDHSLRCASKRMEANLGVTGPQRLVIRIVGRFPGIAAGHLAQLLRVHPSTLTHVLRRLEQRGLVGRRPDPRDARRALLALTDNGRLLDVETEGTIEAAIQQALEGTPDEAIEVVRGVLLSISESLNKSGRPKQTRRPTRPGNRARADHRNATCSEGE